MMFQILIDVDLSGVNQTLAGTLMVLGEGRSEGLHTLIKDILSNTHNALQINENEIKNNLSRKKKIR